MTKIDADRQRALCVPRRGSLYVLDYAGEEPAIVLMHGFPDDHRIYDKLATASVPEAGRDLRLARIRSLRSNR